jgi:hypothetical protein
VWQYKSKEHKRFEMKLYKLCDGNGYMYNITVYLGIQLLNAAFNINLLKPTGYAIQQQT